ncbi:MAG: hypothetical protein HETSPECPRED_008620 [Heterodermia speciosa]|uniref:Uncharacterized protein n=1 Tax=Heterodermia speciosa TaxID=116794 RepID=A0A8H3IY43_9LECA|nr:MAG: hypothetical protein HETSPECPRED_008620 [Heterodermia speciosa]
MLSSLAVGFLLSSIVSTVSGQSSSAFDTSAFYNAIPSVLAIPSVQSALEAQATAIAANPTFEAALSAVPGISTKDVAADLASAFDEAAEGHSTLTASALSYLNAIPSTGAANSIVNSAYEGVILSALNDNPGLFSKTSVSFYIGTSSQASGAATPTGVATTSSQTTSSQASGVTRSSGATEANSTGVQSSSSTGDNSAGAQSSAVAATTVTPKTSTAPKSSAPVPQSTNGGVASQPIGAIMAAGAAAAGVLGFAAFL